MHGLTVFFDKDGTWEKLLKVFKRSWEEHMDIPLTVITCKTPPAISREYGLISNTVKLAMWNKNFTQDTIFLDCDLLIRANIKDGFDQITNIGITKRDHISFPFNAGVVFAKHTQYSKEFLGEWQYINDKMYHDPKFHQPYRNKYAGINQSALGYMLEDGWKADYLSQQYNLCEWKHYKDAKVIHIKGKLRRHCLGRRGYHELEEVGKLWKGYDG